MGIAMDDPLDYLFWRGEILQILYWLRGESLGENVAPNDLEPFLSLDESNILYCLKQMQDDGFVEHVSGSLEQFALTALGIEEGGRLFADEFEELTRQGHGECNNPLCECKTLGPEYCLSNIPHDH
jgi:hypothetical protein